MIVPAGAWVLCTSSTGFHIMLGGFLTGRLGKQILFTWVRSQIVVGHGDSTNGGLGEVAQGGSAVWAVVCHLAWTAWDFPLLFP